MRGKLANWIDPDGRCKKDIQSSNALPHMEHCQREPVIGTRQSTVNSQEWRFCHRSTGTMTKKCMP